MKTESYPGVTYTVIWTLPSIDYRRGFKDVYDALDFVKESNIKNVRITRDIDGEPRETVITINPE